METARHPLTSRLEAASKDARVRASR